MRVNERGPWIAGNDYKVVEQALLAAAIYPTGRPLQTPVPLLVTFTTSPSLYGTATIFPSYSSTCTYGCALWYDVRLDDAGVRPGDVDALWAVSSIQRGAEDVAGLERHCALPPNSELDDPWCYCIGAIPTVFSLCTPTEMMVRISTPDRTKLEVIIPLFLVVVR